MEGATRLASIKARWQFFRLRFKSNMENPPRRSPEQRLRKARTGVALGLFLGVIALLLATVGGQSAAWFTAVGGGGMAFANFSVVRSTRRQGDPDKHSRGR